MDIVKKNWLSIVCGVVAILAIVADFYPMGGMRSALKAEAAKHAAVANELYDLAKKERKLPGVDPDSKDQPLLTSFPTEQIIANGTAATEKVQKAAEELLAKASEMTVHTTLVDGVLPGEINDKAKAQNFARAYAPWFVIKTTEVNDGKTLAGILQAARTPSADEINTKKTAVKADVERDFTHKNSDGAVINAAEVQQIVADKQAKVPDEARFERARACKIYLAYGTNFVQDPAITVDKANVADIYTKIFQAQLGLWCQQDLAQAIAKINEDSPNVMEAPVKEWIKFTFAPVSNLPSFVYQGVYASANFSVAPSTPPPTEQAGALPADSSMSPTRRQSNQLFDVVQFDIEMIVEAQRLPQVLASLGDGRYLSVSYVSNLDPVDSALAKGLGFYFGDKPCVKVKVRCEDIFFRNWLAQLMPETVKKAMGIPIPPPPKA